MELEKAKEILKEIIQVCIKNDKIAIEVGLSPKYILWRTAIEAVLQELKEVSIERDDYRNQLNGAFDRGFIPKNKLDELVKEMRKDGSNYWANRIEEKMNKEEIEKCLK